MFSQLWAIGLGLITISLVSGSAYQLACSSMEAHDLPSPVLVAEMALTLTVHVDDDFEILTLYGFFHGNNKQKRIETVTKQIIEIEELKEKLKSVCGS